ncbi:ferritin-like protein [Actinomadura sp. 9N407]|uniref:ferritin-like protein n=1 Tax=Actinomadura sp. 9N407 TaxID=3375154 RepID=UPI0037A8862A
MTTSETKQAPRMEPGKDVNAAVGIRNVQDLADHLYVAAQVELSTIPLYLYSVYSMRVGGHSQWSAPRGVLRTITGIAIEEMLHLALVRNLMVAIGYGDYITFYNPDFLPFYPSLMMFRHNPKDTDGHDLMLSLEPLSTSQVSTFRRVEMPDHVDPSGQKPEEHPDAPGQYTSLGAFYREIELGFEKLDRDIKWALSDVRKQYKRGFWNEFGNGKPIRVYDLATAKEALNIIIDQGEGTVRDHKRIQISPGVDDYTHYEKFLRIERGEEGIGAGNGTPNMEVSIDDPRVTWPVVSSPSIDDFTEREQPAIHSLMELFNAAYCYTLCLLDEIYQHSTHDVKTTTLPGGRKERHSRRYGLERNGIAAMQGILYPIAHALVSTPITTGTYKGRHAGPSFEYYDFAKGRGSKKKQLVDLCDKAIQYFPELGGPDGVRRQISLLAEV